ncbi:hypothetical protein [Maricaulis parjimensis]|uniref:hypothetical protein n=1 Tax=Maricaulis parjimensis TaxID=144023 RepID=UPI00193A1E1D|nr:hypothetical protein [Maricaulis parjimensis]
MRLLIAVCLLLTGASALAQEAEGRLAGPVSMLFPHRTTYLELAEEDRSHFRLDYVVQSSAGVAADEIGLWYERGGAEVRLDLTPDGLISNPPDADTLDADPDIWTDQPGRTMSMSMQFAYDGPDWQSPSRQDLVTGLSQANRAVRRTAGVAALFAPDFKTVIFQFDGPAPDAWAIDEAGERHALTVQEDRALFRPRDRENRRIVRIELGAVPERILFDS